MKFEKEAGEGRQKNSTRDVNLTDPDSQTFKLLLSSHHGLLEQHRGRSRDGLRGVLNLGFKKNVRLYYKDFLVYTLPHFI